MLVAKVPVAASAASTAICSKVEDTSGSGAVSIVAVWSAMGASGLDEMTHIIYQRKLESGNRPAAAYLEGSRRHIRHCERQRSNPFRSGGGTKDGLLRRKSSSQ